MVRSRGAALNLTPGPGLLAGARGTAHDRPAHEASLRPAPEEDDRNAC